MLTDIHGDEAKNIFLKNQNGPILKDQSMKFKQKKLRIGEFEKLSFFESATLDYPTLVYSKRVSVLNSLLHSVCKT